MSFSNKLYPNQNFFRYCLNCTSFSPKTLTPKSPSSNSAITFSLRHSSLGSSAYFRSESRQLRKRPVLSIPSSWSSSYLHFGLRSLQTTLSTGSSSSGLVSNFCLNPFLHVKNQFWGNSLCGLLSKFEIESLNFSTHTAHTDLGWLRCGKMVRCYTVSSSNSLFASGSVVKSEVQRKNSQREFVLEVVGMIRNNGEDLESWLNMVRPRLNAYSITEIFEFLNYEKVPGLRFFEWIWSNNLKLQKNSCARSLIIDNLGRLEDYGTMRAWFKKFACEKIYLTYEAFGFLPVMASNDASLKESTKTVLDLLNEVGGSFQSSGICALIEMFCKFHLFEMARHVITIAGSKESYYRLLIREMCRSGLIEEAHDTIREMRQARCAPTTTLYNYLLGSLWKNSRVSEISSLVNEMKENNVPLDAVTYEILIISVCSLGDMDAVHHILDQMVAQGLQPRLSTHACIIKSLFAAEKYEAAYKHVVYASGVDKTSSNMVYSLTARLYKEKGHIMSARNTLVDMMEKGLQPNSSIFVKIVKHLRRTGRGNLARDLESRHSKFICNPNVCYVKEDDNNIF